VNALEILAVVSFVALVILASTRLPKLWRSDERVLEGMERSLGAVWPYGRTVWRGVLRGLPAIVIGSWFLTMGGLLALAVPAGNPPRSRASTALFTALLLAGVGFCLCFALHIVVILFNRPKWIVPPLKRAEPGALAVWSRRKRGENDQRE